MISYLFGRVLLKDEESVVLNVGGVGYKVFLSDATLKRVEVGQETELYCFLRARENAMDLFGVATPEALQIFEKINDISGIGPKTALEVADFGSVDALQKAVKEKGAEVFEGMKGIGKKRIQKILLEVSGSWKVSAATKQISEDALKALVSLGFSKREAKDALEKIPADTEETEQQIKEALKLLGN